MSARISVNNYDNNNYDIIADDKYSTPKASAALFRVCIATILGLVFFFE